MKVTPILTEKSLNVAKEGKYTFVVDVGLNKLEIAKLINSIYAVHVKSVRTLNYKAGEKRNVRGRKVNIKAFKKAVVTLGKDEKIDAFEVKKGKSK
ncbi:50S ribosomal protein L23 [Candidatus Woesebacteria bacterium CG22_combo_CG10-13_8_21_14_all_39_10]|uniref:50S ribosomal protein L23 n=3 Tax=Candidatus Woeseibacteriota TaxID=1752722 RepID=A0A2M7XA45_9BACT|nr:MAG: 50S ribosomal protein L23 [Candidatus Woesebacteria bacterium CG22_combo_CG10-13_8_21_14_all_39_10]PIZ46648.1 MAG: 50S ribosomal protein L23 [Candidatus Woesebacteria bacterium CG_4_10_14_0_2_um_filter_39_14]PJA43024.1 MAG: 50S ribosomal protein L23 [Candidatus Woesebacteria bacterium CG_4_9_14_3_um_filter_39_10]